MSGMNEWKRREGRDLDRSGWCGVEKLPRGLPDGTYILPPQIYC